MDSSHFQFKANVAINDVFKEYGLSEGKILTFFIGSCLFVSESLFPFILNHLLLCEVLFIWELFNVRLFVPDHCCGFQIEPYSLNSLNSA